VIGLFPSFSYWESLTGLKRGIEAMGNSELIAETLLALPAEGLFCHAASGAPLFGASLGLVKIQNLQTVAGMIQIDASDPEPLTHWLPFFSLFPLTVR